MRTDQVSSRQITRGVRMFIAAPLVTVYLLLSDAEAREQQITLVRRKGSADTEA